MGEEEVTLDAIPPAHVSKERDDKPSDQANGQAKGVVILIHTHRERQPTQPLG